MKNTGMFTKVYGLITVPTIAFLALSVIFLISNFNIYNQNKEVKEDIPNLRRMVNLISVLQVERGMSAAYLGGANNFAKLKDHRLKVEGFYEEYLSSNIKPNIKSYLDKSYLGVKDLREKINTKSIQKKEVVTFYTRIVEFLMSNSASKIDTVVDSDSVRVMINLVELNGAKEKAGLLRAGVSSLIARGTELSAAEKKKILMLYGSYKTLLNSNLYKFSIDSKEVHSKIQNLPSQKVLDDTVSSLEQGEFLMGSSESFSLVTGIIKEIDALIYNQVKKIESISVNTFDNAKNNLIIIFSTLAMVLLAILLFSSKVVIRLVKKFRENLHSLNNKVLTMNLISEQVSKNSKSVFDSSNNQARGIQGTSSAIHEIKEILSSSSAIVNDTMKRTETCTKVTEKGKVQVNSMLSSINEISSSNESLIDQVKENNENMSKVTSIINEIAQKTSVINDIVFQTKLLSFNASVEAARAGEHGKGFSVVAEEIGALANMSGTASSEIEELINSSIGIVNKLSTEMVEKINHFVELSSKNIKNGNDNASQCSEIFEDIYKTVKQVSASMEEINASSSEQRSAITEIANTVQELDKETASNLKVVEKNSKISENLGETTVDLKRVTDDMCIIVRGETIDNSGEIVEINNIGNDYKKSA